MENRKEFTFPSADGRTAIHAVEWHPEREPAGIFWKRRREIALFSGAICRFFAKNNGVVSRKRLNYGMKTG